MSDAQAVASESTSVAPTLESLDSSQMDHWRMTGELPSSGSRTESTPPADSSPAPPVAQADQTESSRPPASEPGKPSKPNAETRKPELQSDIQELLATRARLRADIEAEQARYRSLKPSDVTPAASSPATARPLSETIQTPDIDRPPLTDAEFTELYPEATLIDLNRYAAQYQILSHQRQQAVTQERQGRTRTYTEHITAALAADPQFWTGIDPRLASAEPVDHLPPNVQAGPMNVIAQEILLSDAPAALLKHLSAHPEVLNRLLASPNAIAIARGIGRLEASLTSTAPQPAPAGDPVSLAPPPSPTLGKKPAQPADELAEAIKSGDFARYRELQNRKEMKSA